MLVESCVLVKSEYSNVCRCVRNSDSTLFVSFHSNLPLLCIIIILSTIVKVTIGKMMYDPSKGKGIVDKGFMGRKVFVNKDASYSSVVKVLKKATFPTSDVSGKQDDL